MIETYRILNNIDKVDHDKLFPINTNSTRGHSKKIYKRHNRTNIRKFCFTHRVVDSWNSLPANVADAKNVNNFKSKLNAHWKGFYQKFNPNCNEPEAVRIVNTCIQNGSKRHSLM